MYADTANCDRVRRNTKKDSGFFDPNRRHIARSENEEEEEEEARGGGGIIVQVESRQWRGSRSESRR
jgi:hypothetical protein